MDIKDTWNQVYKYALLITKRHEISEEIAQEVCLHWWFYYDVSGKMPGETIEQAVAREIKTPETLSAAGVFRKKGCQN